MIKKVVSDSKATNSPNEIVSDITNLLPIQIIINVPIDSTNTTKEFKIFFKLKILKRPLESSRVVS